MTNLSIMHECAHCLVCHHCGNYRYVISSVSYMNTVLCTVVTVCHSLSIHESVRAVEPYKHTTYLMQEFQQMKCVML